MESRYHSLNIIFLTIHHFDLSFEIIDFGLEDTFSIRSFRVNLSDALFVHSDLFELVIALTLISRVECFEFFDKAIEFFSEKS